MVLLLYLGCDLEVTAELFDTPTIPAGMISFAQSLVMVVSSICCCVILSFAKKRLASIATVPEGFDLFAEGLSNSEPFHLGVGICW